MSMRVSNILAFVQLSVNLLLVHDIFVHLDSYLFYLQTYKKSCVSIKKIILSWTVFGLN